MSAKLIIFLVCIFLVILFLVIDIILKEAGYKKEYLSKADQINQLLDEIKSLQAENNGYKDVITRIQHEEEEYLTAEGIALKAEVAEIKTEKATLLKEYEDLSNTITGLEKKAETITAMMEARVAAIQREQTIKENMSDYCLSVDAADLADIEQLNQLKPKLHKPRILCMLIWQTYFQKQLTALCNSIFGAKTVCGIYKITNQLDNYCYVGQSVDIAKRIAEHVKCGLGIDTPAGNKLYDAMLRDGVQNFSFELLEACPRTELDAKEKEYISIYDCYNLGYNSNRGNSVKKNY